MPPMNSVVYQFSVFRLVYLASLVVLLSSYRSNASGSNFGSRNRYAAYDYDLTTPQYTPDGRLLQVEYALNACRRAESNPIVSVGLCIPGKKVFNRRRLLHQQQHQVKNNKEELNDDSDSIEIIPLGEEEEEEQGREQGGDALLIMATISSPPPSSSSAGALVTSSSTHNSDEEDQPKDSDSTINTSLSSSSSLLTNNNQRTQRRIIEVPLSTSFQTQHTTTTTAESTILIGLSGILADATSLLQIAYSILEEEQISFGWHRMGLSPVGTVALLDTANKTGGKKKAFINNVHLQQTAAAAQPSETAVRLARAIGDKCQKHSFGGGLRPLGASLLVAGIDSQESSTKLAMCETEPSGAVSVINPYWSTTPRDDGGVNPPQVMVSGGSIQTQSKLKQMMASRMRQIYREIGTDVENEERAYSEEAFLRRALQTVIETLVEEWKGRGSFANSSDRKQQPISLPQMEVVFTTSRRGTFRLSEDDIQALMETTEKELQTS